MKKKFIDSVKSEKRSFRFRTRLKYCTLKLECVRNFSF